MKLTDRSIAALKPKASRFESWIDGHKGLGVRVSTEGTKTWVFMYRHSGKQRRMSLGRYPAIGVAQANRLHADALEQIEHGIDPASVALTEKAEERAAVIDKAVEVVFEEFMTDHVSKLRTGDEIRRKFELDILPRWGKRRIDEITRSDVKALLREKARSSPIAANRLLAAVRKFFNWAIDEEIIQSSPVVRLKPPTDERARQRDRVLSEKEIRLIWNASDEMAQPFGNIVKMLFLSAGRLGEVGKLQWPEIDFDENLWRLPAERYKTQRAHIVPLAPAAIDLLDALYENDKEKPSMFIHAFRSGRKGDRPASGYSRAKTRLDLLVAKANADVDTQDMDSAAILEQYSLPSWRFHDIRRTVATSMRQGGADRLTVQKILGHADNSVTGLYDRYGSLPEMRRALETWATRLAIIVDGDDGGKVVPIRHAEGADGT